MEAPLPRMIMMDGQPCHGVATLESQELVLDVVCLQEYAYQVSCRQHHLRQTMMCRRQRRCSSFTFGLLSVR